MFYWAFRAGRSDQGVGTCSDCVGPPTNITGGDQLVPLSSPTACRIDPLHGLRPPLPMAVAPLLVYQWIEAFLKKSFSSGPLGQSESGRFGRFACKSSESFATAQRAECLLRSDTRGPSQSKAICARHAVGVASGHSLSGIRALLFRENSAYFA